MTGVELRAAAVLGRAIGAELHATLVVSDITDVTQATTDFIGPSAR
jgi:hypothetical protein